MMQQQPPQQQQQHLPPTDVAPHLHHHHRQMLPRPPFVDPTTNIIYDTDHPDYEGWLTKQSMWLKDWRRRYFLLKGSKLFFAKSEYSAPHGMIDLASCTTVKSADLKSRKRHSFEISTPEITYLLYADTEKEKDDWIGNVGKAIVQCSRTFYSQDDIHHQQQQQRDEVAAANAAAIGAGGNAQDPLSSSRVSQQQQHYIQDDNDDDDDIYTNDDPNNPYFND